MENAVTLNTIQHWNNLVQVINSAKSCVSSRFTTQLLLFWYATVTTEVAQASAAPYSQWTHLNALP